MIKMCGASIACKTKEDERAGGGKEAVKVMVVSEPVNFNQFESGMIKSTRL